MQHNRCENGPDLTHIPKKFSSDPESSRRWERGLLFCSSEHFLPNDCWISLTGHFNRKVTLLHRMSLITHNAKEYRSMTAQYLMSQIYLSSPYGIFCLYVILTISYLRAETIETSSLPTDSSRPLFKQIKIFSGILPLYFNCKYFP